ncbi:MAG TPA: hypothetical protein VKU85_06535, partial [bacterium]|nr:hypothetical protein [bacterium]
VVDVSDPTNPALSHTAPTSNAAIAVAVSGDHAFVADNSAGLHVVQVSAIVASPPAVGVYNTPDYANDVEISGDHAFVADWSTGLVILDITDPTAPTLAGTYDTAGPALGITVAGDHAFVADGSSGLQVIDVSDPTSPTLVGTYDTPGMGLEVVAAGDHVFVADFQDGLQVLDISDPAFPALAGSYNTPGFSYGVAVAGDHAFLADGASGLQVIDVSNPSSPTLAGSYDTPGTARAVVVSGDHAYVADYDAGIQILDVSDPTNPVLAGSLDTAGLAFGIAVCGNQVFVGDYSSGLQVVDVSDPTNPVLVGGGSTLTEAERVAISGRHAFVTDGTSGLRALHVRQDEVSLTEAVGQSVPVDGGTDVLPRARITATQTAGISWEVSPDAGASWVPSDGASTWTLLPTPGSDLLWRSTHAWAAGLNPTVSDLTVEWLTEGGPIAAVADVPGDQGGEVRVEVVRSGYDFADEPSYPVAGYQVYQRVDSTSALQLMSESPAPDPAELEGTPQAALESSRVRKLGQRTFVLGGTQGAAGTFPPGLWEAVGWIAATQSDSYLARVTTTGDSSAAGTSWAVYFVTTHTTTPSVWFGSAPDSGYSVDNLAPSPPTNLVFGGPSTLVWDPAPEGDFAGHTVYGSPGALLDSSAVLLATTTVPTLDVSASPHAYYHVTTSDHAGNESAPAALANSAVAALSPVGLPAELRLHSPRPNPMRSRASLRFDLPRAQTVRLAVYDVAGR